MYKYFILEGNNMSNYSIRELERKIENCRDKEVLLKLLDELGYERADDEEGEAVKQKLLRIRGRY